MWELLFPHILTNIGGIMFVVVQSLSCVRLFVTSWTAAHQGSLSFIISWSLLKLMSIESGMPSNHLVFCHPLLLLPSVFLSIWVSSNESALCIRWPKYWNFIFSISPSNEYSELISFRIDWFDLLAVQGTLKTLLQHHTVRRGYYRYFNFFPQRGVNGVSQLSEGYPFVYILCNSTTPDWVC